MDPRAALVAIAVATAPFGCSSSKAVSPATPIAVEPVTDESAAAPSSAPIADAPPSPSRIDGALPSPATLPELAKHVECAKGICSVKKGVPDEVRPAAGDLSPAVMWEEKLGKEATVTFPRIDGVELYAIVLSGDVTASFEAGCNEKPLPLQAWGAVRAWGAGASFKAGGAPARVVLALVTTSGMPVATAPTTAWKKRDVPMRTLNFSLLDDLSWGGGAYHARLGFGDAQEVAPCGGGKTRVHDAPAAALDVLLMSADAPVPQHQHDKEWEILAALQGEGELLRTPSGPAAIAEHVPMKAGSIAYVPPSVLHSWTPSGAAPLLAIQLYSPPGPELRFRKLAGK